MKRIYKYTLTYNDEQAIKLPRDANILSVGKDAQGNLAIWAEVEPHKPHVTIAVSMRGTGRQSPEAHDGFLGTVIDGDYVWHFFITSLA